MRSEQSQRQNPLSIELLVRSAERYLSKSEYRIQLDELFTGEAHRLLKELDAPEFDPTKLFDQKDLHHRVQKYESITEPLARMVGVLGRWGDDSELPLVLDIINSLYRHSEKIGGGMKPYLNIRSYPAVFVFTAYGLGLTRSERWLALHSLFTAAISRQHKEPRSLKSYFCGLGLESNKKVGGTRLMGRDPGGRRLAIICLGQELCGALAGF